MMTLVLGCLSLKDWDISNCRDYICSSSFAMCTRKSLISSEEPEGESLSSLMLPKNGVSAAEEGCCDRLRGNFLFGDAADYGKIEGTASSIKYRRPVKLLRKSVRLKYNVMNRSYFALWSEMLGTHPVEFWLAKPKTRIGRMSNNSKSKRIISVSVSVTKQERKTP